MEPDDRSPHGVSPGAPRRGLWRSLVSAARGEAAPSAQHAVGSVEGVGAGDQRRPFAELSPEEQADRRREAARKAAATRARNRARQAAEAKAKAAEPAQVAQPAAVEDAEGAEDAEDAEGVEVLEVQEAQPESRAQESGGQPVAEVEEPAAVAPEPVDEPESAVEPEPAPDLEPVHEADPAPEPDPVEVEEPEQPAEPEEPVEVVGVQSDPQATTSVARTELGDDAGAADASAAPVEPAPPVESGTSPDTIAADASAAAVVLRLEGVTRRFGQTTAVDDVTIEVRAGECVGIVGPNGAGKSTTVSLAGGLMRATSGDVQVGGIDVHAKGAQALLGVVPDRMRLFDRLTGRQLLVHAALLRRVPRKEAIARAATLLERFDLTPDADRLVSDYSIGMQQLVGIAAALIHAPKVVVLDEPFESIDPVATDTILAVLADLRRRGGAVVLTSHDMQLVERACDHVVVLADGVVRAAGSLDDVRDGLSLEDRFTRLVGASPAQELPWLSPSLG